MEFRSLNTANALANYKQFSQPANRTLSSGNTSTATLSSAANFTTPSINPATSVNNLTVGGLTETQVVNASNATLKSSAVNSATTTSSSLRLTGDDEQPIQNASTTTTQEEEVQQQEELATVRELSKRDREVRAHEAAHAAAGGQHTGAPSYTYTRGPDGKLYATAGSVPVDTSEVANDPEATITKAETVIRAALAPVNPSPEDIRVAAEAQALLTTAKAELAAQTREEQAVEEAQQEETEDPDDASSVEVNSFDSEKIRENNESIEDRLTRSQDQQEAFADQLQELNRRVSKVLQQVINTGASTGITSQGTFIDISV